MEYLSLGLVAVIAMGKNCIRLCPKWNFLMKRCEKWIIFVANGLINLCMLEEQIASVLCLESMNYLLLSLVAVNGGGNNSMHHAQWNFFHEKKSEIGSSWLLRLINLCMLENCQSVLFTLNPWCIYHYVYFELIVSEKILLDHALMKFLQKMCKEWIIFAGNGLINLCMLLEQIASFLCGSQQPPSLAPGLK